MTSRFVHPYGPDPSQVGELFLPDAKPRSVAVLLHGGFWRDRYASDLMVPLAQDLASRGWAAWNLEYRRLGSGGGWPATFDDVAEGVERLRDLDVPLEPIVAIGHSAGGHLALWLGSRSRLVSHVVAQAAVSDLAEAARLGLSSDAALELVGHRPGLFPAASPAELLPLGVPQLLVHGTHDDIVPVSMSRAYCDAALAAGDRVALVEIPEGHFECLEPGSASWKAVLAWLP